MTRPTTSLVVVSHSADLAAGVVELAEQMAPDVVLRAAGGTDEGALGTSFDRISAAVSAARGPDGTGSVVVLTDLGSATMTAEAVLEVLGVDERVQLADGPLVEGAVAAAVAAQGGAPAGAVRHAAEEAALAFAAAQRTGHALPEAGHGGVTPLERTLVLGNELGLHARAAAMLSRLVVGFDARVEVNGVDGASVLALMGLGLGHGEVLTLRATGPQAEHALDAIAQVVEDRFGEE
ncbi:dihydroxyacetone kinase phosphoryl donor subunit DhaM [Georgenia wangjunii]|uniref:dihydroxyacetone kinase phosphoryl donor subunit DhaM n=1 Tax=Georgenia wangjunii TaxID=3117730 RepID=UPI002F260334